MKFIKDQKITFNGYEGYIYRDISSIPEYEKIRRADLYEVKMPGGLIIVDGDNLKLID